MEKGLYAEQDRAHFVARQRTVTAAATVCFASLLGSMPRSQLRQCGTVRQAMSPACAIAQGKSAQPVLELKADRQAPHSQQHVMHYKIQERA